ncbi:bifunctional hydroxylase/dehydrase [Streptomyces sp. TLI_235]|nr:FAD-dependent monooxygenase [Streptomyces sp. TLI_235]PBC79158.1 bifunctional hydroxylase/dehydrase [Streptomyces sp. TLI_235]
MTAVVIAGGGPVGLMLACELGLAGIDTVVLERLERPTGESRALGLHSRTVEVLHQRGLLDRVGDQVPVWPKGHFAGLRKVDMTKLDAEHSYALMVPQSRTEEILYERALELKVDIRRGHRLVSLEQGEGGVTADVEGPDGTYRLDSRYLVGCDGGASTVRKLVEVPFPGTASTVNAMLGDVQLLGEQPSGRELLRLEGGLFGLIPLGDGLYRVVAVEFDVEPVPRDVPVTTDELAAAAKRVSGLDLTIGEARWMSRFGNATRLVDRYRTGSVLLAGDAAHVHFPAGGQGLNTGIQDALNLGWKLAGTLNGWAPDTLLDSYEAERRPIAKRVCMNTRAQLAMMHPAPEIDPLRELFSELMDLDQVNRYIGEMITGLDIRYPMNGESGGPEPSHALVGRRMPPLPLLTPDGPVNAIELLAEGRGLLIDLSGSLPAAWADGRTDRLAHVAATPADRAKTPDAAALLVRPDGYVAWACAEPGATDGLADALDRWFGAAAQD